MAIIGHAYGDRAKSDIHDSMADNVREFLINNSNNLTKVIFTGDVFKFRHLKNGKIYIMILIQSLKFMFLLEIMMWGDQTLMILLK